MAFNVRFAFVFSVKSLFADAACESAHARVDRTMSKQGGLRGETLATLVADVGIVHGQRVLQVPRQFLHFFVAEFTFEDAVRQVGREAQVFGDFFRCQRFVWCPASSLTGAVFVAKRI